MLAPDGSTPDPSPTRICNRCGIHQSLDQFRRRNAYCRECERAANRKRYAGDRERLAQYARDWRAAHPERVREIQRKSEARRPPRPQDFRQRRVEAAKEWLAGHPEKLRAKRMARKARERGAPESEWVERAAIWERDGGVCHYCGQLADPDNWHLDHLIPISKGGSHTAANLAVCHPRCNMSRGNSGPAQPRLGL